AERVGDPYHLTDALVGLGLYYVRSDAQESAMILLSGAGDLGRRHHLLVPTARALMNLGTASFGRDPARAMAVGREARTIARQAGSLAWQALTTVNLALACWDAGEWDEIRELFTQSAEALDEELKLRA